MGPLHVYMCPCNCFQCFLSLETVYILSVCMYVYVSFFMQKYWYTALYLLACMCTGIHTFAEVAVMYKSYGNVEDTGYCS